MSVHVLSEFMDRSRVTLGARLVGMVMADAAGDDGICWLDQNKLRLRAGLSERAVRDALRSLEKLGEIETRHAQRGRRRINVYRIWCGSAPDYDRLPFEVDRPFVGGTGNRPPADSAGGDDRQLLPGRPAESVTDDRQNRGTTPLVEQQGNVREHKAASWSIDKRHVEAVEHDWASAVLVDWNTAAGQSLTARDWLAMIIRRHRERPELSIADLKIVIERNLADPWWKGVPSPNVIFGSAAQFERALTIAANPKPADDDHVAEARSRFANILGGRR